MASKKFEHGGNIYDAARNLGDQEILDFSANINPFGLSKKVKQAIVENIDQVVHYPDVQAYALRKAICDYYEIKDETLMLGNGATELFYLLCSVLKPKKVLLPVPSFSEYERVAFSVNAIVDYFYLLEEDVFAVDFNLLAERVEHESLLFLGNPNNPTGKLLDIDELDKFLEKIVSKRCVVVVDESFIDFLVDAKEQSCRHLCAKYRNLYIVHSMTKFFAIPGLRLGFGIFPEKMVELLQKSVDCWNVNSLAQVAGVAGLSDKEYIEQSKKETINLRNQLVALLIDIGNIRIFPSVVNFLLLDISGLGVTSGQLCEKLAKHGVLIRDCANFPSLDSRYVRIAVRSSEENIKFAKILQKVKETDL